MADPVVLIGIDLDCGSLEVVGLYETTEAAQAAVQQNQVPSGYFYSVMTPKIGSWLARRTMTERARDFQFVCKVPDELGNITGLRTQGGRVIADTESGTSMIVPVKPK